jgi:hypothetical protein
VTTLKAGKKYPSAVIFKRDECRADKQELQVYATVKRELLLS